MIGIAASSSGGVGGPVTQWRINITGIVGGGSYVGAIEIEMRATSGGADLTGSGTASASSSGFSTTGPADAFDNNAGTEWVSSTGGGPPEWIAYDFGVSTPAINEIVWTPRSVSFANQSPSAFDVQYWNGAAWVTSWSKSGVTWPNNSPQTFTGP